MDRGALAEFLRSRRARLQPGDVGLDAGIRRRTPGLRREEVARLAAISVDYYTRMEQARGPRPSRQVLAGIGRALRLSGDERAHLFLLAGEPPEPLAGPSPDVRPGILHLIDRLDDSPAYVLGARYDVLAWNSLAAALIGDFSGLRPAERNVARLRFLGGEANRFDPKETLEFARGVVADLRAASARYPDDADLRTLITDLRAGSAEFAELWAEHDVRAQRDLCQTFHHPAVGTLVLQCEVLLVPEHDQRVVIYTAQPASPSHEALQLLKVIGTQSFTPASP